MMTHSTATSRRNPDSRRMPPPRKRDTPGGGYAVDGATALAVDEFTEQVPAPARATPPGRPRLRVAPPVPVSGPRAPFVALVLFVVIAGVLGILVLNTKINENAFRLGELRDNQATLDRQEQELNQNIADLESPNNLAAAARRLGLVPSGTPAFIKLPDGRVLGVPQPSGGQPSASHN
jgi:cell division protein FtsB